MPSRIAEVIRPHLEGASKAPLFGSVARWQADSDSYIDLILVWPDDYDKDPWDSTESINEQLRRFTGNPCNTLLFTESEFEEKCPPWLEREPDFPELPRTTLDLLDNCSQYQQLANVPRMTRGGPRRRPCDGRDVASRIREAETFAAHAEIHPLSEVPEDRSTAVSMSVMAGVAASDAICCKALGEHSASPDHRHAVEMLKGGSRHRRRHFETPEDAPGSQAQGDVRRERPSDDGRDEAGDAGHAVSHRDAGPLTGFPCHMAAREG